MPESVLVRFKGTMRPGVTLRDLVNAIPLYAIKAGLLTVEKKGKKNIFSGRILEIEGLPDLKVEQAFELSDASAERSAAGCTVHLNPEPIVEYIRSNVALMKWMIANGYAAARTLQRRIDAQEAWLADPKLLAGDAEAREYAIAHSVCAKARIVAEDERETTGKRALLNLGHTFGHALEAETGFSDRLLHGEGVAAGMALAFAYSARRGLCPGQDAERVAAHLRAVGLPDGIKAAGITASGATLVDHMRHDKKMDAGTLPFLLAHGIGRTYLDHSVDLADVEAFLDAER